MVIVGHLEIKRGWKIPELFVAVSSWENHLYKRSVFATFDWQMVDVKYQCGT